jgi:predicted lysophospholipase L1 biosynthesis ABC-type transport system permease subunit
LNSLRMEWEEAEARLESRSAERRESLDRRDRRRRLIPWLLCLVPLPAAGAAALVAVLREADEKSWPAARAAGAAIACVLVPALLAGWIGRRHGRIDAVLWALVSAAITLALAFGVGFLALDLGP